MLGLDLKELVCISFRKLLNKSWQVKSMAKKFDLVLIDAPCSGIGTWSRNPESRFNFTKDNLYNLIEKTR